MRDWLILGQLRLQLIQAAAALDALKRADAESPGQASSVNALAHSLVSLSRAEEAYSHFQGQIARTFSRYSLRVARRRDSIAASTTIRSKATNRG